MLTPVRKKKLTEAITETLALHHKAISLDINYTALKNHDYLDCPLCIACDDCEQCPWVLFTGNHCNHLKYGDSEASITRLEGWLKQLREDV